MDFLFRLDIFVIKYSIHKTFSQTVRGNISIEHSKPLACNLFSS